MLVKGAQGVRSLCPLGYGSETWVLNTSDQQRLCSSDRFMIPWICGTKGRDKTSSASLLRKLAMTISQQSLVVGGSLGMDMSCVKSVAYLFPAFEGEEGIGRGPNVVRMVSVNVASLALTHKRNTEHGELVFDVAWCCQHHRIWHGQHPNLNLDMVGWT